MCSCQAANKSINKYFHIQCFNHQSFICQWDQTSLQEVSSLPRVCRVYTTCMLWFPSFLAGLLLWIQATLTVVLWEMKMGLFTTSCSVSVLVQRYLTHAGVLTWDQTITARSCSLQQSFTTRPLKTHRKWSYILLTNVFLCWWTVRFRLGFVFPRL